MPLAEFISALRRRKWQVLVFIVVFAIGGGLYGQYRSDIVTVITLIDIGSVDQRGTLVLAEQPERLLAKLENYYIPAVLLDALGKDAAEPAVDIIATLPSKRSSIVKLSSRGREAQVQTLIEIHGEVLNKVVEDHRRVADQQRASIRSEIAEIENQIRNLESRKQLLGARAKSLEAFMMLLRRQYEEWQQLLESGRNALANRNYSDSRAVEELVSWLSEAELSHIQNRLFDIEKRMHVDLPREAAELERDEDQAELDIKLQEKKLEEQRRLLETVKQTRAVRGPTKLSAQSNLGPLALSSLAALIGLFLGALWALISEEARLYRSRAQINDGSSKT